MKLAVLGTAGYHPNEQRHTTSVVIPEVGIVLDAGTSLFRLPQYIETPNIDILLSHAHLDHIVGLTYLLDILYQKPLEQVRVHGEPEKLKAIRQHLFAPELFPVEPPYTEIPLAGEFLIGEVTVKHCSLTHPGGSVGYRLEFEDRSLAFITDTTASPEAGYAKFIQGVDLLIHECNFSDEHDKLAQRTGHSCLTPVVELAQRANVGGVVLLHFNPLSEAFDHEGLANAEKALPIALAEDGMEIDF